MMNDKFIYVYSDEAKEIMLEAGYTLLQTDQNGGIFVFLNEYDEDVGNKRTFALNSISYVTSNTLLF